MSKLRSASVLLVPALLTACAASAPTRADAPAAAIAIDVPAIQHPDGETPAWW